MYSIFYLFEKKSPPALPLDMKAGSTEATLAVRKACMLKRSSWSFGQIITYKKKNELQFFFKIGYNIYVDFLLVLQDYCFLQYPETLTLRSHSRRLKTL